MRFDGHGTVLLAALGAVILPASASAMLPDADGDGDVDLRDVAAFANCLGTVQGRPSCANFDGNTDGSVDLLDWTTLNAAFFGAFSPCPGDVVLSPANGSNIPATLVTFFGRLPFGTSTTRVQGVSGYRQNDGTYFAPNIALRPGANIVRADALDGFGSISCSQLREVFRNGDAGPLSLRFAPQSGPPGIKVGIRIDSPFSIEELRLDVTGDGVVDLLGSNNEATHVFNNTGRFTVFAVARISDGFYLSNLLPINGVYTASVVIGAQAPLPTSVMLADPVDVVLGPGSLFSVLGGEAVLTRFDTSLAVHKTLALSGVTGPAGLALSSEGEIIVADSGGHRILKFDANGVPADGFGVNGGMGRAGGGLGQVNTPTAVSVALDGTIFVADHDNSRLVKLRSDGRWISHLTMFQAPLGLVVDSGTIFVVDGSDVVRAFDLTFLERPGIIVSGHSLSSITSAGGVIVATSSDGVHVRTVGGGFVADYMQSGIDAAVYTPDAGGTRLTFVNGIGDTLSTVLLPLDPPGTSPLEVWERFLTALSTGNIEVALAAATDEFMLQAGDLTSSEARSNLVEWLSHYHDFRLVSRGETTASYEVQIGGLKEQAFVAFQRIGLAGEWRLSSY